MQIATTSASALAAAQAISGYGPGQRSEALFMLVILTGVFLALFGLFGAGRLIKFVSHAVMSGFLIGVAVVLILDQLSPFAGIHVSPGAEIRQFGELVASLGTASVPALAVGLATVALACLLKRTRAANWSSILAVALPTAAVAWLGSAGVATVADENPMPYGFPPPHLPDPSVLSIGLAGSAAAIAIIVAIQGAGVSQSLKNPDGTPINASTDIVAQGAANVAAGLFSGIPAGGSVGQTILNVSLGARSRWAAILHGIWMLMFILLLPQVVGIVPMPVLAALMILAGIRAIDWHEAWSIWNVGGAARWTLAMTFVATLVTSIPAAVAAPAPARPGGFQMATTNERPSFIFILADDLGFADLGCYGGRTGSSPNLDRMASEGLRFTSGYANSSVCSPSRFAIITGRWQHRLRGGADEPIAKASPALGLPPAHPTMPSLLRDSGYATALFGKWHLGAAPWFGPLKSGYQHFFGHMGGAIDYFRHQAGGHHDLWEGEEEVFVDGYTTDLFTDRAVAFIEEQGDHPYLLSLHYNAVHWPWEARSDRAEAERIENIVHTDGGSVDTYHVMLRQMDEGIGRVLDAVDRGGNAENTLVLFTSDNGGERFSDMWPLTGKKMDLLEGGIRVPYIVRWPARLRPGETTDRLAIGMDWMVTFLAAAGVEAHPAYPLDGIDLFGEPADRALFWRMKFRDQKAVRRDQWKWISIEGNEFLFDVVVDERERANKRYLEPDRFRSLRDEYSDWERTVPPIPKDASVDLAYSDAEIAHPW
jgi:arylsulfatase A-like enzyme